MSNKIGCPKCEYTGFAYGKIPCVCQDNRSPSEYDGVPVPELGPYESLPLSRKIALKLASPTVSGLVVPPKTFEGAICYYGSDNKLRSKVDIGSPVTVNGVIV